MELGFQRFYDKPLNQDKFYLVLSANIRSKHYNDDKMSRPLFDNLESMQMVQTIFKKLRSMRSMDFRQIVFKCDLETLKEEYFFVAREALFGKTLVDVCLSDPISIIDALKKDLSVLEENDTCIIAEILRDFPEQTRTECNNLKIMLPNMICV